MLRVGVKQKCNMDRRSWSTQKTKMPAPKLLLLLFSMLLLVLCREQERWKAAGFALSGSSCFHRRRQSLKGCNNISCKARKSRKWSQSTNYHWQGEESSSSPRSTDDPDQQPHIGPIPAMPSPLFVDLAQNQLELLVHALQGRRRKIGSIALYLPQENKETGQLEFVPAVLYPHPSSERVFIAHNAQSGVAPTLPKTLTKLPGFAHAATLLPGYPMVSSSNDDAGVGVVEEVLCDFRSGAAALSVPLFLGSRTVGVLLVWPSSHLNENNSPSSTTSKTRTYESSVWTQEDRDQISRAAQSLSLALSMDMERADAQLKVDQVRVSLSDSVHQVKNPLQALRTFGKLLQRRVADTGDEDDAITTSSVPELLELAQHLMIQSDRVADMLLPMDSLVSSLQQEVSPAPPLYLTGTSALTEYQAASSTPWRNDTTNDGVDDASSSRRVTNNAKIDMAQHDRTALENRPNQQPVELEMAFVTDTLEPIFSAYRVIASEQNVGFQVLGADNEDLPGVMVCQKSLQEAVSNVLDNAFKYVMCPKKQNGGDLLENSNPQVVVQFLANRQPPAGVTILVQDNGPGVSPRENEAIFERGYRSAETSSMEGTGIGLDIARSLVTRMGGTLKVVNKQQQHDDALLDGMVMKIVLFREVQRESF